MHVTRAPTDRSHLSIGEVLALLQEEFPDVTISKIRFLESQGLLDPERTPSGYRKFYEADIDRLRWILRQQKDHFLPLKVIKDRLDETGRSDRSHGARPRSATTAAPAGGGADEPGPSAARSWHAVGPRRARPGVAATAPTIGPRRRCPGRRPPSGRHRPPDRLRRHRAPSPASSQLRRAAAPTAPPRRSAASEPAAAAAPARASAGPDPAGRRQPHGRRAGARPAGCRRGRSRELERYGLLESSLGGRHELLRRRRARRRPHGGRVPAARHRGPPPPHLQGGGRARGRPVRADRPAAPQAAEPRRPAQRAARRSRSWCASARAARACCCAASCATTSATRLRDRPCSGPDEYPPAGE